MTDYDFYLGEEYALKLDAADPLTPYRKRFYEIPGKIYMDGNSLGLLSIDSERALERVLSEWKQLGIAGWWEAKIPWINYAERLGSMMAPIIGARSDEVVVTGGTTVNLHALASTFYQPESGRTKILADELNFPSDLYALQSQIVLKGLDPSKELLLVKSRCGNLIEEEDIIREMGDDISLAVLPSVYYRSGQLLDMSLLTKKAHERGIIIGFDLAHSIGVIPHKLAEWDVDFAFWCNYKYMNGGPGATGGLYVNRRHFGKRPALAGWFGNERSSMFDMNIYFKPAESASAWQIGTTTMLSSAPIEGSVRLVREAGIHNIREKSRKITSYLIFLVDELLGKKPYSFGVASPRDPDRRGGHVGVTHKEAWRINQALIARGVIPDFRPPDIIRLAPIPLYISYHDVWSVVHHIRSVIDDKEYLEFSDERSTIT
ncbi:MAG: kynureninase [Candidatus Bathyarchaeia archaeon]